MLNYKGLNKQKNISQSTHKDVSQMYLLLLFNFYTLKC